MPSSKQFAWEIIRGQILHLALVRILPGLAGGFQYMVVKKVLTWSLDKYVQPVYKLLVNKGVIAIDYHKLKKIDERLQNAKTESDFDSAVDDML